MPVYQYRGIACDHEFEVRQSFADDPIATCEVCGLPVRRVIHASPVMFKGSGWYVTDSRPTSDPVGGVQEKTKSNGEGSGGTESTPAKNDPAPAEKAGKEAATPAKAS